MLQLSGQAGCSAGGPVSTHRPSMGSGVAHQLVRQNHYRRPLGSSSSSSSSKSRSNGRRSTDDELHSSKSSWHP